MKALSLIAFCAILCLNVNAQLNIKAKFQSDGVYWNKIGDNNPQLARLKFNVVTLEKRIGDYYMFKSDGMEYYTTDEMLYPSYRLDSLNEKVEFERSKAISLKNAGLNKKRHESLIKKYGKELGEIIYKGKVRLGMTKNMAIASWGKPNDIHETILPGTVNEQWVYSGGNYLYFKNGVLVSIQN